jgi:hypothetical protein
MRQNNVDYYNSKCTNASKNKKKHDNRTPFLAYQRFGITRRADTPLLPQLM